jgi:hypothetical protein
LEMSVCCVSIAMSSPRLVQMDRECAPIEA